MLEYPDLQIKFKTHVQKSMKINLSTITNATPGFVQFSSKQKVFISTDPLLVNITAKIKKTAEIIK